MTPPEAAAQLAVDPKRVRAWLRIHRTPSASGAMGSRRADVRGEIYVIDLCDELLGERASRQHRFDWLVGDPGRDGRPRALLVDAFYRAARTHRRVPRAAAPGGPATGRLRWPTMSPAGDQFSTTLRERHPAGWPATCATANGG